MGLGVGWILELKLNRKEKKNWIPTGGLRPPYPPKDPLLIKEQHDACF